ncbi:MAG: lipid IV(A) 3-deoxy-D-manno-octulosonic acid transferase [Enterobacteriaceae bacterium]
MLRTFYTVLLYLLQPFIWLRLWRRGRKAPAYRKRWAERYGFCKGKVNPGGILLHSVSVGETLAAVPLVRALRKSYPGLPITVTTMTPTGSERVQSALGTDIVQHVYLPYDLPGALRRFLQQVQPSLVIIMETELWPNLIAMLHQRNIPLVIANARLSERSARGYHRVGWLMKRILPDITLVAAQSQEDGERFIRLGLPRKQLQVTGSLKFDIAVTPELAARAVTLRHQWASQRPVWIAASTHDPEEQTILSAHQELLKKVPDLLLILVPRHPERFSTVRHLVEQAGLSYIMRSSGAVPGSQTQVVIGDTMGELMLLYGIADIAFIGGSLIERGGHNPLEPAAHGIPVIMGPHVTNFREICSKLQAENAQLTVNNSTELVNIVSQLLEDEGMRHAYGRRAQEVLVRNQGALQKLLGLLEPLLPQRRY